MQLSDPNPLEVLYSLLAVWCAGLHPYSPLPLSGRTQSEVALSWDHWQSFSHLGRGEAPLA